MREAAAAGEDAGFTEMWKSQRTRFVNRVHEWLIAGSDPARSDLQAAALDATVGTLWHRCLK